MALFRSDGVRFCFELLGGKGLQLSSGSLLVSGESPEVRSDSASVTSLGYEVYEHNNGLSKLALLLEDWELGRVALCCHMAMDLLCQEMRDACWDSSESLGSPRSLCSQCQAGSLAEG